MTYYDNDGVKHQLLEATNSYSNNIPPVDHYDLQNAIRLMNSGADGQYLVCRDGRPQWVNIPPNFKDYLDKL